LGIPASTTAKKAKDEKTIHFMVQNGDKMRLVGPVEIGNL
jgi:hypothetical protein